MRQLLLSLLLFVTPPVSAQSDWQEALHDWLTAEDIEESYGEELMEQLEEQALSPINLNQTSREELEALPFLTAQQVEGVMEYIERYRPIRSLSELQMVKALDPQTRRLLFFFVVAGEERKPSVWPSAGELLKNGKHHFTVACIVYLSRCADGSEFSLGQIGTQCISCNSGASLEQCHLLDDVLELAHITWPVVPH